MRDTFPNVIKSATEFLTEHGVENARLDAEILFCHLFRVNRVFIYANDHLSLQPKGLSEYKNLIQRRADHEPVAYITGHREFMGLDFRVTPDVLIPRPETEILVEETIKRLKPSDKIADIGTGSGAICISILKYLPNAFADTVDISDKAINVARQNAKTYNVADRIKFHVGDLLDPLGGKKFNAIVSNPPYIPTEEINKLESDVAKYEPISALDGGADGLEFYRRLIDDSPNLLIDGGFLAIEIGINQSADIKKLFKDSGQFADVEIIKDLSNINRVMIGKKLCRQK